MKCPYCNGVAQCQDNIKIYKTRSYGFAYICENYPQCNAYVGVHKGTTKALGRLANPELRSWKIAAHNELDSLWKGPEKKMNRKKAYALASKLMGVSEFHIGESDVIECKKIIIELQKWKGVQLSLSLK